MNYGLWGAIMAGGGGSSIYAGIKLKHKSRVWMGIGYLIAAVLATIASIVNIF
ncbi:MAG: hypothetical protein SOZ56_01615 [Oscillospiraceae bacterium]|nr:hypothetical protein [Oscillospiraceae bacterium]